MEIKNDLFIQNENINSHLNIIEKIKKGELYDIFNLMCKTNNDSIILDYIYFKYIATKETYDYILSFIINNIDKILKEYDGFCIHINMKNLSIVEIDKHKPFIQNMSEFFKEKYPKKLSICYVYNAPFVFSQLFNILSLFIDKETQSKIKIVNKS